MKTNASLEGFLRKEMPWIPLNIPAGSGGFWVADSDLNIKKGYTISLKPTALLGSGAGED